MLSATVALSEFRLLVRRHIKFAVIVHSSESYRGLIEGLVEIRQGRYRNCLSHNANAFSYGQRAEVLMCDYCH